MSAVLSIHDTKYWLTEHAEKDLKRDGIMFIVKNPKILNHY